jgi:hypothetical protein
MTRSGRKRCLAKEIMVLTRLDHPDWEPAKVVLGNDAKSRIEYGRLE